MFGSSEMVIVLVIVLVLFGGSQLPKLARNLGKAQKEFKDGIGEADGQGAERRGCIAGGATPPPAPAADRPTAPAARRLIGRPLIAYDRRSDDARRAAPVSARGVVTTPLEDPPTFTFAASAPHAVFDALLERVVEARDTTGQSLQILRARSTPTPSLGKNAAGG